ncbi:MAG TPA: discoidin domain-containing protein [Nitrospiraceae bacterium]
MMHHRSPITLTLVLVGIWLLGSWGRPAEAITYYVNNVTGSNGTNNSAKCTVSTSASGSNPWLNITNAINNCAGPGHVIRVINAGQPYTDLVSNNESNVNWPVGTGWGAGQFFTLEGDPGGPRPILKPTAPGGKTGFSITYANVNGNGLNPQYIHINYFEVDGNSPGDDNNFVGNVLFFYTAPHIKVTNSKFHNASNQIISGGAKGDTSGDATSDFTFQNNEVYDAHVFLDTGTWPQPSCKALCSNPDGCPCGTGGYCLYISPTSSLIADNLIHDCRAFGIHFYHGGNNSLIHDNLVTRNTIYKTSTNDGIRGQASSAIVDNGHDNTYTNNLLYSINVPAVTGCEGLFTFNNDNPKAYNNTLADSPNCYGFYFKSTAGGDVRGNIIFNTGTPGFFQPGSGSTATFSDNFTSNPSFLGAASGNYHIASTSTARASVGGGCPNVTSAGVTVDIDQDARPASGNFDCGADQVGAPVVTASQLEFGIQPSDSLTNATLTPLPTVRVETSNGSLVPTATDSITLALVSTQIPQGSLTFVSTDSFNVGWGGALAIDGNTTTAWHTDFTGGSPGHPHNIVLSFPSSTVNGLVYTPRLGPDVSGQIIGYNIYVSTDCATWGTAVGTGSFGTQSGGKRYGVSTTPKVGTCLKLESTSSLSGTPYASAAEINVLAASSVVPTGSPTQSAAGGIATFTTAIPTAGVNYVFKATASGLTPQLSLPFTIADVGGGGGGTQPDPAVLLRYVPGR